MVQNCHKKSVPPYRALACIFAWSTYVVFRIAKAETRLKRMQRACIIFHYSLAYELIESHQQRSWFWNVIQTMGSSAHKTNVSPSVRLSKRSIEMKQMCYQEKGMNNREMWNRTSLIEIFGFFCPDFSFLLAVFCSLVSFFLYLLVS